MIAFSAVGSLQEIIKPRDFVVPDQIIDRTKGVRPFTFFEGGVVGHVPFGDPFDENVAKIVRECGHSLEGDGVVLHDRGTLICMGTSLSLSLSLSLNSFTDEKQRALNFPPAPKATCTAPSAVPSSTCPPFPKQNSRAKPNSHTR